MMQKILWTVLAILLSAGLTACYDPEHGHQTNIEKIHATPATTSVPLSSTDQLPQATLVEVASVHGTDHFYVTARTDKMTNYPCARCHAEGVLEREQKDAHWKVKLKHASADTMTCATCHGTSKRQTGLVSLSGKPIDFNRVDQLCAQCHFQQAKDWNGGAHGKRQGGWAPPRVATACTGCHDPHTPSFPTRWPSTFGIRTLEREGGSHG